MPCILSTTMSQDPAPYKPKDTSGDEDVKKASAFLAICNNHALVEEMFGLGYYMPHKTWGDRPPYDVSMIPLTGKQVEHLFREKRFYPPPPSEEYSVQPFELQDNNQVFQNAAMAVELATKAANAMKTLSEVVNTVVRDKFMYPVLRDERAIERAINMEWDKLDGKGRGIGNMTCEYIHKESRFDIVVTIHTLKFSTRGKKTRKVNYVIIAELKVMKGATEPLTIGSAGSICDQITQYANGQIDHGGTTIPLAMMLIYRISRHVAQRPAPDNAALRSAHQVHTFWWPTKRLLDHG
jgi:hypothetical protein